MRASVAVQACQTVRETRWLLDTAATTPWIQGVVGWVPFAAPDCQQTIDELRQNPLLRGLRHVVQAEPEGFLDRSDFNRGIATLEGTGLIYDLLIFARQLKETIRFVDRYPGQSFVLDHIAKPDIQDGTSTDWATDMAELARRPNVVCKLSGMVTEADWQHWTPDGLRPYFETVLEAFGPSRIMVGSDWPVITLACEYSRWWQVVQSWIAPLSASERDLIEGAVATRVYGLKARGGQPA